MTTQYLEHAGGKLAFDDTGLGPLVICVPSMGDMRMEYRFLVPQLVAAGYRVVTLDVRGHGESSVGWSDYSAPAIGADILALIKHLHAGSAVIVGTSMAAAAGVWASAESPNDVAGLVLIGPFVRDTMPLIFAKLMATALFARPWRRAVWNWYYSSLYPTQKPADFAQYRAALRANLGEPGRFTALKRMMVASKAAVEARLHEVSAPVLVIMGTKDPDFKQPADEARLVAERLRGTVQMIEGAGHYPHAEMPAQTGALIAAFVEKVQELVPHDA